MEHTTGGMLPNFVNLLLSIAWGWSALCRLAAMHRNVKTGPALVYVAMFVAAWPFGLQFFFFGTLAGWADVLASCIIVACVWSSVGRWRNGVPAELLRL